jgi:plasmid stabilization system protein ParE
MSLLDWIEELSPAAAGRAADRIEAGLADLGLYPESGRPIADDMREKVILFGRDGYVARYRIQGQSVLVLRLFHGRQNRQSAVQVRD